MLRLIIGLDLEAEFIEPPGRLHFAPFQNCNEHEGLGGYNYERKDARE
jgi:hypothetical protein